MKEYFVIYSNSNERRVSSGKTSEEDCKAFIERSKKLDQQNGVKYFYIIVKEI